MHLPLNSLLLLNSNALYAGVLQLLLNSPQYARQGLHILHMLIQSNAVCTLLTSKLEGLATPSGVNNTVATGANNDAATGADVSDSKRQTDGNSHHHSKSEGAGPRQRGSSPQQDIANDPEADHQASLAR